MAAHSTAQAHTDAGDEIRWPTNRGTRRLQLVRFRTDQVNRSTMLVTANGEIDAHNADALADYTQRHADGDTQLILDLSGLDFFGTHGVSSLNRINTSRAHAPAGWVIVQGHAAARVLRLTDPGDLPVADSVAGAQQTLHVITPATNPG
jgi:anti-anti-sigma factor